MKKTYLQPEQQVVDIVISQPLMTASPIDVTTTSVNDPDVLLAPEMDPTEFFDGE